MWSMILTHLLPMSCAGVSLGTREEVSSANSARRDATRVADTFRDHQSVQSVRKDAQALREPQFWMHADGCVIQKSRNAEDSLGSFAQSSEMKSAWDALAMLMQ